MSYLGANPGGEAFWRSADLSGGVLTEAAFLRGMNAILNAKHSICGVDAPHIGSQADIDRGWGICANCRQPFGPRLNEAVAEAVARVEALEFE